MTVIYNGLDFSRNVEIHYKSSRTESFDGTILEAIYCKRPVVAFRVGGIEEILPENYEYLIKPFDIEDFSNKTI